MFIGRAELGRPIAAVVAACAARIRRDVLEELFKESRVTHQGFAVSLGFALGSRILHTDSTCLCCCHSYRHESVCDLVNMCDGNSLKRGSFKMI